MKSQYYETKKADKAGSNYLAKGGTLNTRTFISYPVLYKLYNPIKYAYVLIYPYIYPIYTPRNQSSQPCPLGTRRVVFLMLCGRVSMGDQYPGVEDLPCWSGESQLLQDCAKKATASNLCHT